MGTLDNSPPLTQRHNVLNALRTGPCLIGLGGHCQCLSYMFDKRKRPWSHRRVEFELEDMDILFGSFVFQVMKRRRPRKS